MHPTTNIGKRIEINSITAAKEVPSLLFPLNSVDTQIISINICNTNAIIKANTPFKMDNSLKETSRTTLTNNVRKDSINGTAILINTCFL